MSRHWRTCLALLLLTAPAWPAAVHAQVPWPPSSGLLVGEVVTGGASGSDEYVELFNAATAALPLDGLELVYVSASGGSVTRKRTWTERSLGPGAHLLLANVDGAFASIADHTYSGGLSAAGGSLVLRVPGGDVIDSLSWGTAASAYVEGTPGTAPEPGFSLERRPGGGAGNGRDTNDNAADTLINATPMAESSAGAEPRPTPPSTPPPTPAPTAPPTPAPTAPPTPAPTPKPTVTPTLQPTALPTPQPTAPPTSEPPPDPPPTVSPPALQTPRPTAAPTAAPSPGPTPAPSSSPGATVAPGPPPPLHLVADVRRRAVGTVAATSGTVTVEPGRILGERTLVLQDATGGLAVRLPSGYAGAELVRGDIIEVSGALAAPYGNLELRASSDADVTLVGSGGLPQPVSVGTDGLREANEGLLATLTASVVAVDRYDSGAVSIVVEDAAGPGRVYAFAPVSLDGLSLAKGQRIRATGIVGQRASSGVADGYRLWPRGTDDVQVLTQPPVSTPRPTEPPDDGADDDQAPPRVRIADATAGSVVTIVAAVTSDPGLIDGEGRRVTVEDRSGAILLRYPADAEPPSVGWVVRATGTVGTWYGSRQLEATATPRLKRRMRVEPTPLSSPPAERHEWQLVSVKVLVTDVERDGDSWRAEASLPSGASLPIAGLAGAGIDPSMLEEGRQARIVGIVKRAHPSATDQRFAIAPRWPRDIRLGELVADEGAEAGVDDPGDATVEAGGGPSVGAGTAVSSAQAVALSSLAGLDDVLVRVGGRVEAAAPRRLTLADGSASGVVRVPERVAPIEPGLRVGEVVNVTGRVRRRDGDVHEVVVGSTADIRRAATLTMQPTAHGLPGDTEMGLAVPQGAVKPESPPPGAGLAELVLTATGIILGIGALASVLAATAAAWLANRPDRSSGLADRAD